MKAIDIIKETVEYYSKNPRGKSIDGNTCLYYTNEKSMCAVGRCLKVNEAKKLKGYMGDVCSLVEDKYNSFYANFEEKLKIKYKGQTKQFWNDLQEFHDADYLWVQNELGGSDLTESGKNKYQHLLNTYANA